MMFACITAHSDALRGPRGAPLWAPGTPRPETRGDGGRVHPAGVTRGLPVRLQRFVFVRHPDSLPDCTASLGAGMFLFFTLCFLPA